VRIIEPNIVAVVMREDQFEPSQPRPQVCPALAFQLKVDRFRCVQVSDRDCNERYFLPLQPQAGDAVEINCR
jgi:hypothetical protein